MNPFTKQLGHDRPIDLANILAQFSSNGVFGRLMPGILSQLDQQEFPIYEGNGLKDLIEQKKVAELAEFESFDHESVVQVCLETVEQHPDEVTVLLWNKELAQMCMQLLRKMGQTGDGMTETQAEGLARAILNAGHDMDAKSPEWPPCVFNLLQERSGAFHDYWKTKLEKFKNAPTKGGIEVFSSEGKPFLSLSGKKTTENLSGNLGAEGEKLRSWHLAEAAKDDRKDCLKKLNQRVAPLDYAVLDSRCQMARRVRNEQVVQCTPDQLGALLAQLASLVAPGKNRSFALSFSPEGDFNDVRHMTVFLEKSLEKGAMALKVSVYDPELSGDTSHLRVLPEHLVQLSFHDFDLRHAFHPGTVDILNLMLDDAPLARSLTEKFQFVPETSKVLVSSVLNALAYGNQYGLDIAANRLAMQHPLNTPIKDLNDRSKELGQALRMALVDNRADAIHVLKDSILLMGPLTSSTVKEMVREAESGLPEALEKGAVKAMKAWEDLDALVDLSADLDEQGVLVPDVSRGLGGALRQGVGDVTDIFVRVFGKPRQSLSVREIRDFLLGQAKERRMPMLQELKLPSNDVAMLLQPDVGNLLQRALQSRDKNTIQAYLELVIQVQGSSSKLEKNYASGLLKRIRDICSPRSSWLVCCMRSDSPDFKGVVKSDRQLNALFALAEGSLKF